MLKARGDARSLLSDSCTIRFVHCLLFRYRRSSFLWLFIMRDRLDVDRLSVLARYLRRASVSSALALADTLNCTIEDLVWQPITLEYDSQAISSVKL